MGYFNKFSKEQYELLNQLKNHVFGSNEVYRKVRSVGEEFPEDYKIVAKAIKNNIFSVMKLKAMISYCNKYEPKEPKAIEETETTPEEVKETPKPKPIVDNPAEYSAARIGRFLVPSIKGDKISSPNTRNRIGGSRRELSEIESIQQKLSSAVCRVRQENREIYMPHFEEIEELCKKRMREWLDTFLKFNMNNYQDALEMTTKLHYPKVRLAYWK